MNTLSLYHDLKKRGVILEVDGEHLKVDAPAGVLTEEDRAGLVECKPVLLKFLSHQTTPELEDNGRRFDARPSKYPGYTTLYDPIHNEWHDFPTKDCYPSIVALADRKRRKGGAA